MVIFQLRYPHTGLALKMSQLVVATLLLVPLQHGRNVLVGLDHVIDLLPELDVVGFCRAF